MIKHDQHITPIGKTFTYKKKIAEALGVPIILTSIGATHDLKKHQSPRFVPSIFRRVLPLIKSQIYIGKKGNNFDLQVQSEATWDSHLKIPFPPLKRKEEITLADFSTLPAGVEFPIPQIEE